MRWDQDIVVGQLEMATEESSIQSGAGVIGHDLNWDAPWIEVTLRVELPFWLLVDNTALTAEVGGHVFEVIIHDDFFDLNVGAASDSRESVFYQGPPRSFAEFSDDMKRTLLEHYGTPVLWRKCKTVLKITSRCNEDVWNAVAGQEESEAPTPHYYLTSLCRAHIPVINKVVQAYRLATYDYFAYEVSPWDVPLWRVERQTDSVNAYLVPYRRWDEKPPLVTSRDAPAKSYQLIDGHDLRSRIDATATPGEFEVLDAMNLMERGDYSGAVRRVTTAVEVILESLVAKEMERTQGEAAAQLYLEQSKSDFMVRVRKYIGLSKRKPPAPLLSQIDRTRKLRHAIVHDGRRVTEHDRGVAQQAVDMGRWLFNWFEDNEARMQVREGRIGLRSIGREQMYTIFSAMITPEGVVVSPPSKS